MVLASEVLNNMASGPSGLVLPLPGTESVSCQSSLGLNKYHYLLEVSNAIAGIRKQKHDTAIPSIF